MTKIESIYVWTKPCPGEIEKREKDFESSDDGCLDVTCSIEDDQPETINYTVYSVL